MKGHFKAFFAAALLILFFPVKANCLGAGIQLGAVPGIYIDA